MEKKINQISNSRLISQKIQSPDSKKPEEIVRWMGAMQAQDYSMAKWAIGVRLNDVAQKAVEESIDNGEIIRIHVLRPTWHFISARDVHWMIKLTASKVKSSLKSRHNQLEISAEIINYTIRLLEKELRGGINRTREEIAEVFNKNGIKTDENRLSHILFAAELEGIVCSGPEKSRKQTYSLLDERVQKKYNLSRDESIIELARRYFTSHCPATIQDFQWWSNLSLSEIRKATEAIKADFRTETLESGQYLIPNSFVEPPSEKSVHLLPAYDEFLISYKDRTSSLSMVNNKKAVSVNGIFYPPVIINGQVAGLWKRLVVNNKVSIQINLFQRQNKKIRQNIEDKAIIYGRFLDKDPQVSFKHNLNS